MIRNSSFLITGGTGSFGTTILNHLIKKKPKEIRVFSRDEKKQFDLRNKVNSKIVNFIIGDIRDYESVDKVTKNIDFIFHASALKQVPSCEFFPMEAIKTNILGTNNLINCAEKNNVKKVVILSTDKSVNPINVMGMTKALAEKLALAQSKNLSKTKVCITRYGNVMSSRGSVIPHFISLLKRNKQLTITDVNMTRFMMSLDDSVDLVMKAFSVGKHGQIFVKKSPSANILTLASAINAIYKKKLDYKLIGVRGGEKIHETLINEEEMTRSIEMRDYFVINPFDVKFDYNKYFTKGKRYKFKEYSSNSQKLLNINQTIKLLRTIDLENNTE
tara:strand:- start:1072 stop:2064 length:993 start_codon:yes stop_codon:yes gene_type:complete